MNRFISRCTTIGWAASIVVHAAVVAGLLQSAHGERRRPAPARVTLSVIAPPPAHRPPPTHATDRARNAPTSKAPAPNSAARRAPQPANEPTPVANAPVDLAGVTLTGGEGAGWDSVTGNGLAMDTPIRSASAAAPSLPVASSAPAKLARVTPPPTQLVPIKDLGEKPVPPALDASLRAHYPPLAKRQGLPGSARLLVRIDSDGLVRHCTVQSESSAEFGAACRQTLLGSRWSAPRDRLGKPVATQVYYTCEFRVNGS